MIVAGKTLADTSKSSSLSRTDGQAYANGDGQAEARRKRIFNADGHFAKDISRDVGHAGRRAIHGHGPLLWHL